MRSSCVCFQLRVGDGLEEAAGGTELNAAAAKGLQRHEGLLGNWQETIPVSTRSFSSLTHP